MSLTNNFIETFYNFLLNDNNNKIKFLYTKIIQIIKVVYNVINKVNNFLLSQKINKKLIKIINKNKMINENLQDIKHDNINYNLCNIEKLNNVN
jgi:hypothetical protein